MVCLSFSGDKVNGELPLKEAQSVKNQTFLKRAVFELPDELRLVYLVCRR
jgi:hypothetical protein